MPSLKIGQKADFEQGLFVSLRKKGDSLTIRLLGDLYYNGVHFSDLGNNTFETAPCKRINFGEECPTCEKYTKVMAPVRKLKEQMKSLKSNKDKAVIEAQIKDIQEIAKPFKVKMNFYYPILNRDTGKAQIFKTSLQVRIKIDLENESGTDVFAYDWVVKRIEENPQNYYSLVRVDSAKMRPLTDEEKKEIEKASAWNMGELIDGNKSDSFPDREAVKPEEKGKKKDDMPF